MQEELKPCPFCTGEAKMNEDSTGYYVSCKICGAETKYYNTEKEAAIWWNLRDNSNG